MIREIAARNSTALRRSGDERNNTKWSASLLSYSIAVEFGVLEHSTVHRSTYVMFPFHISRKEAILYSYFTSLSCSDCRVATPRFPAIAFGTRNEYSLFVELPITLFA